MNIVFCYRRTDAIIVIPIALSILHSSFGQHENPRSGYTHPGFVLGSGARVARVTVVIPGRGYGFTASVDVVALLVDDTASEAPGRG